MPGYYLPGGDPDLEDFFSQIVPTPPPTDRVGGMLFIAPLDPTLDLWFAYLRRGRHVKRFDGSLDVVQRWAQAQTVAERWLYATDRAAYVLWAEPPGRASTSRICND